MAGNPNSMPQFRELLMRALLKRRQDRALNPGDKPRGATGRPADVMIEGEDPIRAQPVQGQSAPPPAQPGGIDVRVGKVQQVHQMPPMRFQLGPQQQPPAPQQGPAMAPNQDPRLSRMREMMAQGIPQEEAMRAVMGG